MLVGLYWPMCSLLLRSPFANLCQNVFQFACNLRHFCLVQGSLHAALYSEACKIAKSLASSADCNLPAIAVCLQRTSRGHGYAMRKTGRHIAGFAVSGRGIAEFLCFTSIHRGTCACVRTQNVVARTASPKPVASALQLPCAWPH